MRCSASAISRFCIDTCQVTTCGLAACWSLAAVQAGYCSNRGHLTSITTAAYEPQTLATVSSCKLKQLNTKWPCIMDAVMYSGLQWFILTCCIKCCSCATLSLQVSGGCCWYHCSTLYPTVCSLATLVWSSCDICSSAENGRASSSCCSCPSAHTTSRSPSSCCSFPTAVVTTVLRASCLAQLGSSKASHTVCQGQYAADSASLSDTAASTVGTSYLSASRRSCSSCAGHIIVIDGCC